MLEDFQISGSGAAGGRRAVGDPGTDGFRLGAAPPLVAVHIRGQYKGYMQ